MDYQTIMYDPIYNTIGVECTLTPNGGAPVELTVLDKTAGIEVQGERVEVQTVKPAAVARMAEVLEKGLIVEMLDDALVQFNGSAWLVMSHIMRPSPRGEADGEVYLILQATEIEEQSTGNSA